MNPNDPLEEVLMLKQKATALRNRERFDSALAVLDESVQRLEAMKVEAGADDRLKALVQAELADTHGMKGGINRRRNDPAAALADYQAGLAAEGPDSKNTYNLGNIVQLSILLEPQRIDDGSLDGQIATLLERLEDQTKGARSDEWWAWASLAQFRLLNDDVAGARQAMLRGRSTGPTSDEFRRPLDVLAEIAAKLESSRPERAKQIQAFISEMRSAA
jgi:exonuclease VII small subunit